MAHLLDFVVRGRLGRHLRDAAAAGGGPLYRTLAVAALLLSLYGVYLYSFLTPGIGDWPGSPAAAAARQCTSPWHCVTGVIIGALAMDPWVLSGGDPLTPASADDPDAVETWTSQAIYLGTWTQWQALVTVRHARG